MCDNKRMLQASTERTSSSPIMRPARQRRQQSQRRQQGQHREVSFLSSHPSLQLAALLLLLLSLEHTAAQRQRPSLRPPVSNNNNNFFSFGGHPRQDRGSGFGNNNNNHGTCGRALSGFTSSRTDEIYATDYCYVDGEIGVEDSTTVRNRQHVGNLDPGDALWFDVYIGQTMQYQLRLTLASPNGWGRVQLNNVNLENYDSTALLQLGDFPLTDSWQDYETLQSRDTVELTQGSVTLAVEMVDGGFNFLSFQLIPVEDDDLIFFDEDQVDENNDEEDKLFDMTSCGDTQSGFVSTRIDLVYATDFCAVDGRIGTEDGDVDGRQHVGNLDPGDTLYYDVFVGQAADYRLQLSLATPYGWGKVQLALVDTNGDDAQVLLEMTGFPETDSWSSYELIQSQTAAEVPQGTQTLSVQVIDGGFNLFSLQLVPVGNVFGGDEIDDLNDVNLNDNIWSNADIFVRARDFILPPGVQLNPFGDRQEHLGFLQGGDELLFDLNMNRAGSLRVRASVAAPAALGGFFVKNAVTQQVYVRADVLPVTDNYEAYETFGLGVMADLDADVYQMEVVITQGGFNLQWLSLEYITDANAIEVLEPAVHLAAKDYAAASDVSIAGGRGGAYVGNLNILDWLNYEVDLPADGRYQVTVQVASPQTSGSFLVWNRDTSEMVGQPVDLVDNDTGGWESFELRTVGVMDFKEGTVALQFLVLTEAFNFQSLTLERVNDNADSDSLLFFASDLVRGVDEVSLEQLNGQQYVGQIDTNDLMGYSVNLPSSGNYNLRLNVASELDTATIRVIGNGDQLLVDSHSIPTTPGWTAFQWTTVGEIFLESGENDLDILATNGGFNFVHFVLEAVRGDYDPTDLLLSADQAVLSGAVQISQLNSAVAYLGQIGTLDSILYDVDIPEGGEYRLWMHFGKESGGGYFMVLNHGTSQVYAPATAVPETGGWTTFQRTQITDVLLSSGALALEVVVLESGWNLLYVELELIDAGENAGDDEFVVWVPAGAYQVAQGVEVSHGGTLRNQYVGQINSLDSIQYSLELPAAGEYNLNFHLASPDGAASPFLVMNADTQQIYATASEIEPTGGWTSWRVQTLENILLPGGTVPLEILILQGGWNFLGLEYMLIETVRRFLDLFPTLIPAAAFDSSDGVEVNGGASSRAQYVGEIGGGDSIVYSVPVSAGTYSLSAYVGSPEGSGSILVVDRATGELYGKLTDWASTDGWESWGVTSTSLVGLGLGQNTVLDIIVLEGGFNLYAFILFPGSTDDALTNTAQHFVYARNFEASIGVQAEQSGDRSYVGQISTADTMEYSISISQAGVYIITVGMGSPDGQGSFLLRNPDTQEVYAVANDIPSTGWWTNFGIMLVPGVVLEAGSSTVEVVIIDGGYNVAFIYMEPQSIPALAVDANAVYQSGLDAIAFKGVTPNEEGGYVGSLDVLDSMTFSVDVPETGIYSWSTLLASPEGKGGFIARNTETAEILFRSSDFPSTGDWNEWQLSRGETHLSLSEGIVNLEVIVLEDGWNLHSILLELDEEVTSSGFAGVYASSLDARISQGVYPSQDGYVGNLDALDSMDFILDIPQTGTYSWSTFFGSPEGNGAFLVRNVDTEKIVFRSPTFPGTGDWTSWDLSTGGTGLDLSEGIVNLELIVLEGGWNLHSIFLHLDEEVSSSDFAVLHVSSLEASAYTGVDTNDEGGYVGGLDSLDTLEFAVDVPKTGKYSLSSFLASPGGNGGFLLLDADTTTILFRSPGFPTTADWTTWQLSSGGTSLTLSEGMANLGLLVLEGGWNLHSMLLELDEEPVGVDSSDYAALYTSSLDAISYQGVSTNEGGNFIGSLDALDSMTFAVEVPKTAVYTWSTFLASPDGNGGFMIRNSDTMRILFRSPQFPSAGDWTTWQLSTGGNTLALSEGTVNLELIVLDGGWNFHSFLWEVDDTSTSSDGSDVNTILISSLDAVLYQGVSPNVEGYVGSLDTLDSIEFSIPVPKTGVYSWSTFVASPEGSGGFMVQNTDTDEIVFTNPGFPSTEDWKAWQLSSGGSGLALSEGIMNLKMIVMEGGWSLHSILMDLDTDAALPEVNKMYLLALDAYVYQGAAPTEDGYVGSLDELDRISFEISVPRTGVYAWSTFVASPEGRGAFVVRNADTSEILFRSPAFPGSPDWTECKLSRGGTGLSLSQGLVDLELIVLEPGFNLHSVLLELEPDTSVNDASVGILLEVTEIMDAQGVTLTPPGFVDALDAGDWVEYAVQVSRTGLYRLELSVASPEGLGAFWIRNADTLQVYVEEDSVVATGDWTTFRLMTVGSLMPLVEGEQLRFQLQVLEGGFNFQYLLLEYYEADRTSDDGYSDNNDRDSSNQDNSNSDANGEANDGDDSPILPLARVVISAAELWDHEGVEVSDGQQPAIQFIDEGDWMEYQMPIPESGSYQMYLRVASPEGQGQVLILDWTSLDVLAKSEAFPATGAWDVWETVQMGEPVFLSQGTVLDLRIMSFSSGWNLLWVSFDMVERDE